MIKFIQKMHEMQRMKKIKNKHGKHYYIGTGMKSKHT